MSNAQIASKPHKRSITAGRLRSLRVMSRVSSWCATGYRKSTTLRMCGTFRLLQGEKEVWALPRGQFLREIMFNHWYQHRGQFSVYLRMLDVPVPASWGPSADEPPLFAQRAQVA